MPSIYQLKSDFQDLLRPISDELVAQGFTANQVTVSAVALSGATAYVIAYPAQDERKLWYVLPISLFARMAMNAIDGMMAKEHQQASQLGAVLNEVGDMISDTLLIVALSPHLHRLANLDNHNTNYNYNHYYNHKHHYQHNHAVIALSLMTEVTAIAGQLLTDERANHGPLGKSDRAFELGLIGVMTGSGLFNKDINHYLKHIYLLNELLLFKTITNRGRFIAQKLWEENYQHEAKRLATSGYDAEIAKEIRTRNMDNTNDAIDSINLTEHISSYNGYDGTAMFYRFWLGQPLEAIRQNIANEKIVIMLHRGHEHSARLTEMAHAYVQDGYQVFAWDARGNGRSGGERDHADNFAQLVRDLDYFVNIVKQQTGAITEQLLIIASSLGAVIASSWVHDYAPTVRGMILGTPALSIRLYVPFAKPALKIAKKLGVMNRVSSYVKAKVLTHDSEAQQVYNDDPLISSSISRDLLIDSLSTGSRLLDDAGAFTTPTFIICAGKDYVVDKQKIRQFYEQIRSPIKRWEYYPDSYHAIFHELNKQQVFADCLAFSEQVFAAPVQAVDLTQADQPNSHADSYSKDRVDRLAVKGFNPNFAVTKLAMQKFGHISDGIATGLKHGFDSGSSLQKVYDYAPKGKTLFGKLVDDFYLNNIGWRGIRIRKSHLLELASLAIANLQQAKSVAENKSKIDSKQHSLSIMDIASGNGQYLFELLAQNDSLTAQMRDYDSHNIEVMTDKAEQLGLSKRVTATQLDAFDSDTYEAESHHLAIASGIFELFSDNQPVSTAIKGIHDSLKDGGYFIYTNQPWHPEQEFIGKTLNSHQGKDWVMRCRSQAEIDQLVVKAGFEKVDMRIDEFGIFTVSLARKA